MGKNNVVVRGALEIRPIVFGSLWTRGIQSQPRGFWKAKRPYTGHSRLMDTE